MTIDEIRKHEDLWRYLAAPRDIEDLRVFIHYMNEKAFSVMNRCVVDLCGDRGPLSKMLNDEQYGNLKRSLRPMAPILHELANPLNTVPYKKALITGKGTHARYVKDQQGGQLATVVAPVIASLLPMAVQAIKKWMSGKDH